MPTLFALQNTASNKFLAVNAAKLVLQTEPDLWGWIPLRNAFNVCEAAAAVLLVFPVLPLGMGRNALKVANAEARGQWTNGSTRYRIEHPYECAPASSTGADVLHNNQGDFSDICLHPTRWLSDAKGSNLYVGRKRLAQVEGCFNLERSIVQAENARLQEKFMSKLQASLTLYTHAPRVKPAVGISHHYLQPTLSLAWEYSRNGIEGVRQGHILVVGHPGSILPEGAVHGTNLLATATINIVDNVGDVMCEMNQDGAHVIDGATGRVTAHKFFAHKIEPELGFGGAGNAAAAALSRISGCVTFKISQDGPIKEFRGGKLFENHLAGN